MRWLAGWWHRHRYTECSICGTEFRKHKPTLPSLIGFAYCSEFCEARAWGEWIKRGSLP